MPKLERLRLMVVICCFIIFAPHQPAASWRISRYYHSAAITSDEQQQQQPEGSAGPSIKCGASNYSASTFFEQDDDGDDDDQGCDEEPGARKHLIGGGVDLRRGQFPSFVYIEMQLRTAGLVWCGGSILDERHVLSAARCFEETSEPNASAEIEFIAVYTGFVAKDDYLRKYFVQSVCSPKEFQLKPNYDVAVLKLTEPIEFSDQVQPGCLPYFGIDIGQQVVTIGMGLVSNDTGRPIEAKKLQAIVMTKMRPRHCYAGPLTTNDLEFCLGTERGQICQGDSGGPALALVRGRQTIFGVTSRIKDYNCVPGDSGWSINTDVSKPEIRNIINKCLAE